jgi:hypothetical protein
MTASTAVGISDLGLGYCNQHPLTADKGSKSTGSTAVFFLFGNERERAREENEAVAEKAKKATVHDNGTGHKLVCARSSEHIGACFTFH